MSDFDRELLTAVAYLGHCGATHPAGGRPCRALVGHEFGDYSNQTDLAPHCFYEMGWPVEWIDPDGSPWPESVRRAAAALRENDERAVTG